MLTLASFIVVLGVLIFVHELGHFLAAKAVGIAVPRFSIGFGPPTPLRFRRGETEYQVAWIPLGGFVKMASAEEQAMARIEGDDNGVEHPPERLFENKPLAARIVVISAGVLMNLAFAWAVYAGLLAVQGRAEDPTTRIAGVAREGLPSQAAELARLPFGTRIARVDGIAVTSWGGIMAQLLRQASDRILIEVENDGTVETLTLGGVKRPERMAIAGALLPLWEPRLGYVDPGGPAAKAGLERGDLVVRVAGVEPRSWHDLVAGIEAHAGVELELEVERLGRRQTAAVTPRVERVTGPEGRSREVGRIGVGPLVEPRWIELGWLTAIAEGARDTASDAVRVVATLKGVVLGRLSLRQLGGPVLIGQMSGRVARLGVAPLLAFMALLSVNLAVLNLLPIPVLDGGHLVFLFLEGVIRRPVAPQVRHRLTQAGMAVLLALMIFVFVNDVLRLTGS